MKYKAIFFDRDSTLTYFNTEKKSWYLKTIENWSGKKFKMDYDQMMALFDLSGYPKDGLKSIEDEQVFWNKYYENLLIREGVTEDTSKKAQLLFAELWCNEDKVLYSEVIEVLEYFKEKGYKIGIISDTSPSLQISLENLGLGKYIDSYTCSDLVGFMKPDPRIFHYALDTLGMSANQCLYVDDDKAEADGARDVGFTSFHIDRTDEKNGPWRIKSLLEIVAFVEKE